MANHLTPAELATQTGLPEDDVIAACREHGVPIFNGRIDKTLFAASRQAGSAGAPPPRPRAA